MSAPHGSIVRPLARLRYHDAMDLFGLRALVTGANGNVGSVVAARLAREGCQVRGMVRGADRWPGGETVRADLGDRAALINAARGADLCVNCAAEFSADAEACRRSNVEGVVNLVEALLATDCRLLVHISTISVYDDAAAPDYDEDSPLWTGEGDHPYGPSKAESERIIAAAAARGLVAVILRPALITSMHPRSRWGPQAIEKAAASPDSILPFPEIPHVHVDNLAQAVVLATTPAARGRAYNVVDRAAPGSEYLAAVYAAAGKAAPAIPPEAPVLRFRAQRIRDELGYAPIDRWQAFLAEIRSYRRR
jgi:nucleoside-diphosphate-sugar epimerase